MREDFPLNAGAVCMKNPLPRVCATVIPCVGAEQCVLSHTAAERGRTASGCSGWSCDQSEDRGGA